MHAFRYILSSLLFIFSVVLSQLHSAQSELCEIFVESSADIRMQILEHNRKLLQEKEARNAIKVRWIWSSGVCAGLSINVFLNV